MVRLFIRDNQPRLRLLALAMLAVSLLVLVACEEEHRAVPPGVVRDIATVAADEEEGVEDEDVGYTGLIAGDVSEATRPLSERIFFPHGPDLWYIPRDGEPEPVTEDLTIAAYTSNATGERVAVLGLERTDDDQEHRTLTILLLDQDGVSEQDVKVDDLDSRRMSSIESIALSPPGEEMVITHSNGAMTLVTLDGDAHLLLDPSMQHRPGRVSWSADGQFIAFLDPWMPDEPSTLYVAIPEHEVLQELVRPTENGHGVVKADWLPGTSYIVVVKESGGTLTHGGDLFLLDVETGRQELLMSSGEIAPVAGIVDFAPSPDGAWVAGTGFVPGSDYPEFAGLWLMNLQSGLRTQVDLKGNDPVTDLWWLGDDLLIRTIDEPRTSLPGVYTGQEEFRLLQIDPESGRVTERYPDDPDAVIRDDVDSRDDDVD